GRQQRLDRLEAAGEQPAVYQQRVFLDLHRKPVTVVGNPAPEEEVFLFRRRDGEDEGRLGRIEQELPPARRPWTLVVAGPNRVRVGPPRNRVFGYQSQVGPPRRVRRPRLAATDRRARLADGQRRRR